MCGIAGNLELDSRPIPGLEKNLNVMNRLLAHRGPDGNDTWRHKNAHIGFAHTRLSIIDLTSAASQPMGDGAGNWLVFNGEIYNYLELRRELGEEKFRSHSDTEVILHAYAKWGPNCVDHFRGMFAFALWDEKNQTLFCARDRFGIKPFYYTVQGSTFYFASEIKALLPFMDEAATDLEGFKDYLAFQFCLAGKTLFKNVSELLPGHTLTIKNGQISKRRYWEVYYTLDLDHTDSYFEHKLQELLEDSVAMHLRADVPLGSFLSGGLDSSIVSTLAHKHSSRNLIGFTGKFANGPEYDESAYAKDVADHCGFELKTLDITADDFLNNISKVIYHMDYPVAGPGSLPQFMVSKMASGHRKVTLGGQGGDEIFGGYTRYLIAYFEQCIKGAIDGTLHNGNFIVTYESIIPNLTSLQNYTPLLREFWSKGLFESMDQRYFSLINRAPKLGDEIHWDRLGAYKPFETFKSIFHGNNVGHQSYFDLMTHFDFKTLLPALLQVEDRVSMAHGLESRVPLLDHPLVEFAATIPANVKFKNGNMKHVFKNSFAHTLPRSVVERKDKMGFPTPLTEWIKGPANEFIKGVFSSSKALGRDLVDNRKVLEKLTAESRFGRNVWGLFCLELWQQTFHDKHHEFKALLK